MRYLKKSSDILVQKRDWDEKIYKYNGTLLVKNTDFSIITVDDSTGNSINNIISITSETPHSFESGDNVIVIEADGIRRPNVIVNVGDTKIELEKPILKNGSVTIIFNGTKIQLINLESDLYTFSDGSSLIVNDTFMDIDIPMSELSVRYKNIMNYRLDLKNILISAKKSVLADFSTQLDNFRAIDVGQLEELIIRKIGVFLESPEDGLRFTNSYKEYLKDVSLQLKSDEGKLNRTIGLLPSIGATISKSSDYYGVTGIENGNNLVTSLDYTWGAR